MHGQIISLPNGYLRDITLNDVSFISNLFNEPDIDFFMSGNRIIELLSLLHHSW